MSSDQSTTRTLYVKDEIGYRPATAEEMIEAAREALARRFRRGRSLSSPKFVREHLRFALAGREHEVFCVIMLDNRHHLIAMVELFRGTVDGASVYPREVVKEVLRHNAAAIILVHNHPSGVAEPSQADELITQRLRDALALIDVRILDHLVVGGDVVTSFVERGLL